MSADMRGRAFAAVTGPTASFTHPDGHRETLHATRGEDIRLAVVRRAADDARTAGIPIELVTSGDRGNRHLLVDASGTITPLTPTTDSDADADADAELEEVFGSDAPIFDTVPTDAAIHETLSGKVVRDEVPQPPDPETTAEPPAPPSSPPLRLGRSRLPDGVACSRVSASASHPHRPSRHVPPT